MGADAAEDDRIPNAVKVLQMAIANGISRLTEAGFSRTP